MDISHTSPAASDAPRKPHVVLVGLPGAGKSTVGAVLAAKLSRPFLDFDVEVERREGMPISRIFGERGEAAFRRLERSLTEEMQFRSNMVLAPGGGWVRNPETVSLLRPPATLIYLSVRPEMAVQRLADSIGRRPLLDRRDPLAVMSKLLEERRRAYQTADLEIATEALTPEQVADKIIAKIHPHRHG